MQILYFASIRESLDTDEETFEIGRATPISDILKQLIARGEPWASVLSNPSLLTALNQELVTTDTLVDQDDELALMPPVTGG